MELTCPLLDVMLPFPVPDIPPTPAERLFLFVLSYGLMLAMLMLAIPKKWSDRVMRIAFLREAKQSE